MEPVDVTCHAGYRAEEEPRSFVLGGRREEVAEVLERGRSPSHETFRVRAAGGGIFDLRRDVETDAWECARVR